MKTVGSILYFVCTSLVSLWCVTAFIVPEKPVFESRPKPERVSIIFAGDVMMHTPQITKAKRDNGYDFNSCFRYVKPLFERADFTVANLETTLTDNPPYSGYPSFRSPAQLAQTLATAGVDVAVTANNHSLDAGAKGVSSTIDILEQYGVKSTGTFRDSLDYKARNPLWLNKKGLKIALLAYTYGTNGVPVPNNVIVNLLDTVQIKRDIVACREAGADCTIAFLHWGVEYSHRASREQKAIAKCLHSAGCQVVVGSHPHVVQGVEVSKREVTIYSLGNFVSNQRMRGSDGGIIAQLDIENSVDGCQFWVDIIPVWVRHRDYTVLPASAVDTIPLSWDERAAYDLFMSDCKKYFNLF